jgi:hypothetical protein
LLVLANLKVETICSDFPIADDRIQSIGKSMKTLTFLALACVAQFANAQVQQHLFSLPDDIPRSEGSIATDKAFAKTSELAQHNQSLVRELAAKSSVAPLLKNSTQQTYLKASNTQSINFFGASVAVSGDTVLIGASGESGTATGVNGDQTNSGAPYSGAAYVFVREGSSYRLQAYLKASNTNAEDYFGYSVALSGDTAVIGAFGETSNATGINGNQLDNSAYRAGAAYVFVRQGETWTQQAYLKASNNARGDQFGVSVAIADDTIVVGSNGEDSNAVGVNGNEFDNSLINAGAAYVFVRTGSDWAQQAYLKASNSGDRDFFGVTVAVSDDTIAVGAFGEDSNATGVNGNGSDNSALGAGAAYVFERDAGTWAGPTYLKASNTEEGDQFGTSVAVSSRNVLIGAPFEGDVGAYNSGAAYAFVRGANGWSQMAQLKASNYETDDQFGTAVALAGDMALIGAPFEDSDAATVNGDQLNNNRLDAGAAYTFLRSGSVWLQRSYLKASNPGPSDRYGSALSTSAHTAVVAAPFEDSNATGIDGDQNNDNAFNAGASYTIPLPTTIFIDGFE